MKYKLTRFIILLVGFMPQLVLAQYEFKGVVRSSASQSQLAGVTVSAKISASATQTDDLGRFYIKLKSLPDTLTFKMMGYVTRTQLVDKATGSTLILMDESANLLSEVEISTGYYQLPKERVTGSFEHLNEELLNRSVGTDIIGRLEGVTNGLAFNRSPLLGEGDQTPSLRIRGLSTLNSNTAPLIVLDNFPYEGDINNINPNDIESVTVLKDAAAASIWGARAGNGVIVINTKQGRLGQKTKVSLNANTTFRNKPDLYDSRDFIPAKDFVPIERYLFDRKYYTENDWTVLSPVVELLIKNRDGLISDTVLDNELASLNNQDIREDASRYLYQQAILSQQSLNFSGASSDLDYYVSAGYDQNRDHIIGNDFKRLTLNSTLNYQLAKWLKVNTNFFYGRSTTYQNGLGVSDLLSTSATGTFPYPYTQLVDAAGNALPVNRKNRMAYNDRAVELGLLDWHYKPLEEMELADNRTDNNELRMNVGFRVKIWDQLSADIKYQYQRSTNETRNYYDKDAYYARDLVNQFTQEDLTRVIPYGSILDGQNNQMVAHNGRFQLNFDKDINQLHQLNTLVGIEIRQNVNASLPGYRVYNYNDEVLTGNTRFNYDQIYATRPRGSQYIPSPPASFSHITDRFLSYYANIAYTYKERYVATASSRWDASNLFGVKTNQKGVPLWSLGASWTASKEPFFHAGAISYLRWRATYGSNGNVNPLLSAYPIVAYSVDSYTANPIGIIQSVGNPELRWEKISTWNLGLDVGIFNDRLLANIELYGKRGSDLIGENMLAPTTGIFKSGSTYNMINLVNYANMVTKGFDVQINTVNTKGVVRWESVVLFSKTRNRVTDYMVNSNANINAFFAIANAPIIVGNSKDVIYALPWNGLDTENGNPVIIRNGEPLPNYTAYINSFKPEELVNGGLSVPPYFGSLRNTIHWKGVSLSANITYAFGFKFRRSTINYQSLFNFGRGNVDFLDRWQQSGDEHYTNVPSMSDRIVANRDAVYQNAVINLEKGDHIRLQDINLSYSLSKNMLRKTPFEKLNIFFYAKDLGILWRANDYGIDPSYAYAAYPPPRSFAIGIQTTF